MEATEKQIAQGTKILDTVCAMLDDKELRYSRDEEEMSVHLSIETDNFNVVLVFKVFPERDLITLYSPLTFNAPEQGRHDVVMAMTMLNNITLDGLWTINMSNGNMEFRITNSYCDSIIGKGCFWEMMRIAMSANEQFAEKFFMLGKGNLSFDQFIDDIFGAE